MKREKIPARLMEKAVNVLGYTLKSKENKQKQPLNKLFYSLTPMLIKNIHKIMKKAQQNKTIVKTLLLAVAPLLLFFRIEKYDLSTQESLFENLNFSNKQGFLETPIEFKNAPPHETIFIKFNGSKEFEEKLLERINRIAVRSKSIKISKNPTQENCFVNIYLEESKSDEIKIYPLSRYQPNSDLMFLGKSFFEPSLHVSFRDFFYQSFQNKLEISIKNSEDSIEDLCNLLRCLLNMHSHYYGVYYYVPLKKGMLSAESISRHPFLLILYFLFDFNSEYSVILSILVIAVYSFFPILGILIAPRAQRAIYILFFLLIDFKFAFIGCILWYFDEIRRFGLPTNLIIKKRFNENLKV